VSPTIRQRLGTLVFDKPHVAWVVLFPRLARRFGRSWVDVHNRDEALVASPAGPGFDCRWRWTTDLNVCRFWPRVGRRLMRLALAEWPIDVGGGGAVCGGGPLVSFIIGHRGVEKIGHLALTLRSLLAQQGARVECLVVEQAHESVLAGCLPSGVVHVHSRPPRCDMPYARAWAFNVGARHAAGDILVFHDNDVLAPTNYAAELVRLFSQGYTAARLQRFVFYLSDADTEQALREMRLRPASAPLFVRQNCEGHTLAVERRTYFDLGGHDETFIGWGGEDNEMFDRCRARPCYAFGYLPFVHLHHAPQPTRDESQTAVRHLDELIAVPVGERIRTLANRRFGAVEGPYGYRAHGTAGA
jgi:hypothetical protein